MTTYTCGINRRIAVAALRRLASGDLETLADDARCDASHPFGRLTGAAARDPWNALRRAFPDLERRDAIVLAGRNQPDDRVGAPVADEMVACVGSYVGTFREGFCGIAPTRGVARLDYGEGHAFDAHGRIVRSWLVWDLAGLMIATGQWPMAAPLGAPGHWPAPATQDGMRSNADGAEDGGSLRRVLAMHDALHAYDGASIDSMDMSAWADGFLYWAAGGIGACKGLDGFRAHHQLPFLRAFPTRIGAGHFVRLSDGPYAVTGGDVRLDHSGDEYMGLAPSGRRVMFRVMDFYRFDAEGRIAENWLPNDTLGLMHDLGVDVLARLRHRQGAPRRDVKDA
ncbi:ester cyclase [Jannaschia sp. LMIT008]|uniref:nuclear transport factor 2 family protein n=1 Tax=Jannaschia maritima TaxID=3032585 RepID=UPI002810B4F1|nr:ester cyclase [Jannaschia sp. LMIT008]